MSRTTYLAGTIALITLLGCAPKSGDPAKEAAPTTPPPDGVLSMNYMDAATALSINDFDKAKVSLTALAKESTGEMQTKAQAAAGAADLPAMREAFKDLSAIASTMK